MSSKWQAMEEFLKPTTPIETVVARFSREEKSLLHWLRDSPDFVISSLLAQLTDRWFNDVVTDQWTTPMIVNISIYRTVDRAEKANSEPEKMAA